MLSRLYLFSIPAELLEKISVIKSTNLLEGASRYHLFLLKKFHLKQVHGREARLLLLSFSFYHTVDSLAINSA